MSVLSVKIKQFLSPEHISKSKSKYKYVFADGRSCSYMNLGRAFCEYIRAHNLVIGTDGTAVAKRVKAGLVAGINIQGVNVIDVGSCLAEEVNCAIADLRVDGGLFIGGAAVDSLESTDSDTCIRFMGKNAREIGWQTGLESVATIVTDLLFTQATRRGTYLETQDNGFYLNSLLGILRILGPLGSPDSSDVTVVVCTHNKDQERIVQGLISLLVSHRTSLRLIPVRLESEVSLFTPHFLSRHILKHHAVMGVDWNASNDPCKIYDETGKPVSDAVLGYILRKIFSTKYPSDNILLPMKPRAVLDEPINCCFIPASTDVSDFNECMWLKNAVYGQDEQKRHYFRSLCYSESVILPWLVVAQYLLNGGKALSQQKSKLY